MLYLIGSNSEFDLSLVLSEEGRYNPESILDQKIELEFIIYSKQYTDEEKEIAELMLEELELIINF